MTDLRSQLKARTDKLNGMMEAAAQSAAQIDDLKTQLEAAHADAGELEELRELKNDIERKEKQQAAIIENQVGGNHWHNSTDCAAARSTCTSTSFMAGMCPECTTASPAVLVPLYLRFPRALGAVGVHVNSSVDKQYCALYTICMPVLFGAAGEAPGGAGSAVP
jgi:hypothetical protein